jgi:WD repeat-containing protein 42A
MHIMRCRDLITAYSSDAVYLFSTRDDPHSEEQAMASILPPNDERREGQASGGTAAGDVPAETNPTAEEEELEAEGDDDDDSGMAWEHSDESLDIDIGDNPRGGDSACHPKVPVVYPRRRYAGACNVQTIKDGEPLASFLDPERRHTWKT